MKLRKEITRLLGPFALLTAMSMASCSSDSTPLSFDDEPDASQGGAGGGDEDFDGSAGGFDDAGEAGHTEAGQGGNGGGGECASAADCDDGIECTIDDCVAGSCTHRGGPPGATACGETSFCDPVQGCVNSPVCTQDETCIAFFEGDPCKTMVRCDGALAICTYSPLDNDGDGHLPVVCGGNDCNDADPSIHGGATEQCDGKDNDCNGKVDDGNLCPGLETCQNGRCQCPPANICGGECVDKDVDAKHCGGCFQSCSANLGAFCQNDSTLVVRDPPGVCAQGSCAYPNAREVYCAFGCKNGVCDDDPCIGKICASPPARDCKNATTARSYAAEGICASGVCSYAPTEIPCPHGCANGLCRECSADVHCGSGRWCQNGSCASCDTDQRCGSSCINCSASNKLCNQGSCVECVTDARCGAGSYCSGGACLPCNTSNKCGPSCMACSGSTPVCNGGACVCSDGSCGPNRQCLGHACALCKSDAACGSSCAPCGPGRQCIDLGTSSRCTCLGDDDCDPGDICDSVTQLCRSTCSETGDSVFADDFASASGAWARGEDAELSGSRFRAFADAQHGVRVASGLLAITNKRGGIIPTHGHGYAYVKTGGVGSAYDNALYDPMLKRNTDREVVWTFNMRKEVPSEWATKNGGFRCTTPTSQNYITMGLAYVLGTNSAAGLTSSAAVCTPTGTAFGYAVVLGGNSKLRLVRFTEGLRNGTLTDIVASSDFTVSNFFSVRVTYNSKNDQWKLEVRDDGGSKFTPPKTGGAYHFSGTGTDSTYVNESLEFTGPYFQTGCSGLCTNAIDASFDNIDVAVRCAP